MSRSSQHGGNHEQRPEPLRRTTRAEATQARRLRHSWRTRKLGLVLAGLPVVAIAAAGFAIAAPGHHHGGGQAAACTSAAAPAAYSSSLPSSSSASSGSGTSQSPTSGTGTTANNGAGGNTAGVGTGTSASGSPGTGTSTSTTGTGAGTGTSATASPTTSTSTTASPTTSTVACPTSSASTSAAAAAATPNPNCTIVVPQNPLSAQGLATPYQFTATDAAMGPCNESNVNQSAFVQATIYTPSTGALAVYDPLVIDQGTTPAAAPVVPTIPQGSVVAIWFGFNATNLMLQSANGSLNQGKCVNGLGNSLFTQYAYCNGPAFFQAVNRGINRGLVHPPAPGTATDGQPCMTTRNFALIDQDQSDNVTTDYLALANGQIAQDNTANAAALNGATVLANPSDNALLDNFVDPALGCKPWEAPNLGNNNTPATALALDEIQANAFPAHPSAIVPLNDPMTLVNGNFSTKKTNLYRQGVDQPLLPAGESPQQYCQDMDNIQGTRLQQDLNLFNQPSPAPADASTLLNFLGMRLQQSFMNLNCQNFGLTNPVATAATDGNGVVVAIVFAKPVAALTPGAGNPAQVCLQQTSADAMTACALNAVGASAAAPSNAPASPTASGTPTPQPSDMMRHRGGRHW